MSTIREGHAGGLPLYTVSFADARGRACEATFHSRPEAERFAAEHAPPRRPTASRAAVQRANDALLKRISGRSGPAPKNKPRTLQDMLTRLAGVKHTRGR